MDTIFEFIAPWKSLYTELLTDLVKYLTIFISFQYLSTQMRQEFALALSLAIYHLIVHLSFKVSSAQ